MMRSSMPSPFTSPAALDRKSTRLNSRHTEISSLPLHDALRIAEHDVAFARKISTWIGEISADDEIVDAIPVHVARGARSEEHTTELPSHRDLLSSPPRRSSDRRTRRSFRPKNFHLDRRDKRR